jgi:hypothetical protein
MEPVPVAASDAPDPTTIAAEVLVPPVKAENAELPPVPQAAPASINSHQAPISLNSAQWPLVGSEVDGTPRVIKSFPMKFIWMFPLVVS